MSPLPLFEPVRPKVLSVRQPWAWLIVTGRKTIENRTWQTQHRGPLYIHAGARLHSTPIEVIERRFDLSIALDELDFGAVVGRVDLVDIVCRSKSRWFEGPYGWVFRNAEQLDPIPLRGHQMLFDLPDLRSAPVPVRSRT